MGSQITNYYSVNHCEFAFRLLPPFMPDQRKLARHATWVAKQLQNDALLDLLSSTAVLDLPTFSGWCIVVNLPLGV